MQPASSRPVWLLGAVAAVLAMLVGLVGSADRGASPPRPIGALVTWPDESSSDVLRMPVIVPPAGADGPNPAARPAPRPAARPETRTERGRLVGFVTRPDGEPASAARVALGQQHVRCDAEGRFELDLPPDVGGADLIAFEPGHEPALRAAFGTGLAMGAANQVRLVLGPATLQLSGTVLGPDRLPRTGWTVELDGLDPLVTFGLREPVRTDGDGRFVLPEVPAGIHVVRAWKERPALAFRSTPATAGEQGLTILVSD